jgi:DNA polymerase III epsilon subunit-like protein
MIKPPISIPYNSSQIHHIYDIDVKNAPTFEEKLDEIMSYINDPDIIIGHNVEYDESMLRLELRRLEKEYLYRPKQIVCTMNESTNFCKLPKKNENSP